MQLQPVHHTLTSSSQTRLETQHQTIRFLVEGMSEALFVQRPPGGAWSIGEQAAHLGRYQEVFLERIEQMLAGASPSFERYTADTDEGFARWAAMKPGEILEGIDRGRSTIVELVAGFTPEQLVCSGSHPLFGRIPIPLWIEFFLLHEAHHIYAIMKLRGMLDRD